MKPDWTKILLALLVFVTLISATGSLIYHFYSLNNAGIYLTLFLSTIISIIILKHLFLKTLAKKQKKVQVKTKRSDFSEIFIYLFLWLVGIYILIDSGTLESIISPWQKVPNSFFLILFLTSIILLISINRKNVFSKHLLQLHFFLCVGVATLVYKIGYGFDPFIHETAMELIKKQGLVTPKTWYYIGEYSLINTLHQISSISIASLNKFLVPVLGSLFIPFAFIYGLRGRLGYKKSLLITFFLLILPISIFIVTIPQNLAYVFVIIALALSLDCKDWWEWSLIFLLSLAAFLTHPLAGIPALFFTFGLGLYLLPKKNFLNISKKNLIYIFYSSLFILIPLALIIGGGAGLKSLSSIELGNLLSLPEFSIPNQYHFALNFVYFYGLNQIYFIAGLIIAGALIAYKSKRYGKVTSHPLFLYSGLGLILLFSCLASLVLDFQLLIDYERGDYSQRILELATIFFLPLIIVSLNFLISKIYRQNRILKTSMVLLGISLILASVYLSYPRFDPYHNSRFYSISQADIEAVKKVEKKAQGEDYLVLANQQVSVAALREFGFERYLKDDIYFYPIPTGGKLYAHYLDMVYQKPDRETMAKAMELTGVDKGYFILNEYWWAFDKIKKEARLEADFYEMISDGDIYIFEYNLD